MPADKVAPNRLSSALLCTDCLNVALPAHWQITSKLQHYALFLGNTAKVPLKCRVLNYRAAVGAGTHNLVRKISKQLNRRGRFALGKLLFYCPAAAADARRAERGTFILMFPTAFLRAILAARLLLTARINFAARPSLLLLARCFKMPAKSG